MKQSYFFHNAKWLGAPQRDALTFSVLRGRFNAQNVRRAHLLVLGLGFLKCYINGQCINPDTFLPLSSEYEAISQPEGEVFSGQRTYVPEFDVTDLILEGNNVIAIHFGGGWYTFPKRPFGLPKAIYCVVLETDEGIEYHISDEHCRIGKSYVGSYHLVQYEMQDYTAWQDCFAAEFDDSAWPHALPVEAPDTDYCATDCPADTLVACLPVREVSRSKTVAVYDCGRNTAGYPLLEIQAAAGETVTVTFSESLLPDGNIDMQHHHNQSFTVISDGQKRIVQPEFTWFGFRCFSVTGKAKVLSVHEVHADVPVTSEFHCDNETINWIFRTFIHTMLCNMHTGHPSDCPHLERRGYTGDGQLTCSAALTALDARRFYEKWLQDIADGQDVLSGHIQYTAPYIHSGGGPGGWGCAIVEVPYQLYLHYGDVQILQKYYANMRRYIDYLEAHSRFGLVTSDRAGEWCLGDWCGPVVLYPDKEIISHAQQILIPAPLVNTYFMVKSLRRLCKIAALIGRQEDVSEYEQKIQERLGAIEAAYFNAFDHNFVMNAQGANAFAVDLGIGDEKTYDNLVSYYQKLGHYDTGIFATDILTRILFERGDGELAVKLLTQDGPQGFEHWRQNGATTFHEYWDSNRSRSHNHPMFGAVVDYFFSYLLGISQQPDTAGYRHLIFAPAAVKEFQNMAGSMLTPQGRAAMHYEREGEYITFRITVPKDCTAILRWNGNEHPLQEGENVLSLTI